MENFLFVDFKHVMNLDFRSEISRDESCILYSIAISFLALDAWHVNSQAWMGNTKFAVCWGRWWLFSQITYLDNAASVFVDRGYPVYEKQQLVSSGSGCYVCYSYVRTPTVPYGDSLEVVVQYWYVMMRLLNACFCHGFVCSFCLCWQYDHWRAFGPYKTTHSVSWSLRCLKSTCTFAKLSACLSRCFIDSEIS